METLWRSYFDFIVEHLDPDATDEELKSSTPEYTTRSATIVKKMAPVQETTDENSAIKATDLLPHECKSSNKPAAICEEGEETESDLHYTSIPTTLPYISKCPRLLFHPLHGRWWRWTQSVN